MKKCEDCEYRYDELYTDDNHVINLWCMEMFWCGDQKWFLNDYDDDFDIECIKDEENDDNK